MGQGRDMARALDQDMPHHEVLENFRDQLLVTLLKRLVGPKGGTVDIAVAEVDATGDTIVKFAVQPSVAGPVFKFSLEKKQ